MSEPETVVDRSVDYMPDKHATEAFAVHASVKAFHMAVCFTLVLAAVIFWVETRSAIRMERRIKALESRQPKPLPVDEQDGH